MKKTAALLLCMVLLLFPVTIFGANTNMKIYADKVTVKDETTVNVPISIENNSGICGITLYINYDSRLTLKSVNAGKALSSLAMTKPGKLNENPVKILWDGMDADSSNGQIAILTFDNPGAEGEYSIAVSCVEGDVIDGDLNPVTVNTENGYIEVKKDESKSSSSSNKDSGSSSNKDDNSSSNREDDSSSNKGDTSSGVKGKDSSSKKDRDSSSNKDKDSSSSKDNTSSSIKNGDSSSSKGGASSSSEKSGSSSIKKILTVPKGVSFIAGDVIEVKLSGLDPEKLVAKGKAGIYECVSDNKAGEKKGVVKAIQKGSLKLYETHTNKKGQLKKRQVCKMKIEEPKIKPVLNLKVGKSKKLKLSGTKLKPDSWISSDPETVSVTADGYLTAKKSGNTTISVFIGDHKYECVVMVSQGI